MTGRQCASKEFSHAPRVESTALQESMNLQTAETISLDLGVLNNFIEEARKTGISKMRDVKVSAGVVWVLLDQN